MARYSYARAHIHIQPSVGEYQEVYAYDVSSKVNQRMRDDTGWSTPIFTFS